jgi:hypothetical protein
VPRSHCAVSNLLGALAAGDFWSSLLHVSVPCHDLRSYFGVHL